MCIENMAQNHPELIVRDMCDKGTPFMADSIREVLKNRGINKWLRNRRLVIQLKEKWKREIAYHQKLAELNKQIAIKYDPDSYAHMKYIHKYHEHRIKMNILSDCRAQLRSICHSRRDVDFPTESLDFGKDCKLPKDMPKRPRKTYFKER
jgi:hypothetical protein